MTAIAESWRLHLQTALLMRNLFATGNRAFETTLREKLTTTEDADHTSEPSRTISRNESETRMLALSIVWLAAVVEEGNHFAQIQRAFAPSCQRGVAEVRRSTTTTSWGGTHSIMIDYFPALVQHPCYS